MSWLRVGDDAATYPALLSIAGMAGAKDHSVRETFGFLVGAATLSAAHMTDYFLNIGTLALMGGNNLKELLKFCERSGLLTKHTQDGEKGYLLIQDPNFLHMQSREEVERRRNHDADVNDESITVPVRKRDGDSCRWCRLPVVWAGPKSKQRGEYDHLNPGERATVDTLVVACRSCNGRRKNNVEAWAAEHELHQPPANPLYGKTTAKFLQERGYPNLECNFRSDETPRQASSQAAASKQRRTQAAAGSKPAAPHAGSSPKMQRRDETMARLPQDSGSRNGDNTPNSLAPSLQEVSDSDYRESRLSGSGRVPDLSSPAGSMPAWAGTPWPSVSESPNRKPRRRGKRGGRGPQQTKGSPDDGSKDET